MVVAEVEGSESMSSLLCEGSDERLWYEESDIDIGDWSSILENYGPAVTAGNVVITELAL